MSRMEMVATAGDERTGRLELSVGGGEAEIVDLAVSPDRRRQGVATELLQRALEQASRGGASTVFLEVRETNTAALGLYRRFGFAPVGRREAYYADGETALILRLDLPAADREES